jgi:hypothetical protein
VDGKGTVTREMTTGVLIASASIAGFGWLLDDRAWRWLLRFRAPECRYGRSVRLSSKWLWHRASCPLIGDALIVSAYALGLL